MCTAYGITIRRWKRRSDKMEEEEEGKAPVRQGRQGEAHGEATGNDLGKGKARRFKEGGPPAV